MADTSSNCGFLVGFRRCILNLPSNQRVLTIPGNTRFFSRESQSKALVATGILIYQHIEACEEVEIQHIGWFLPQLFKAEFKSNVLLLR